MTHDEWVEELSKRYTWSDEYPGPETVVEEAKARNIDSLEFLLDKMDDPFPDEMQEHFELDDRLGGDGWLQWKWFRELRDSFLGSPE